jgi:hypothetical protein
MQWQNAMENGVDRLTMGEGVVDETDVARRSGAM